MDWIHLAQHTVKRQATVNRVANPSVLQHAGAFLTENRLINDSAPWSSHSPGTPTTSTSGTSHYKRY